MSDRMTAEQDAEKMRADFEAKFDELCFNLDREPFPGKGYVALGTDYAWIGYQAATLAAQARTAEVVERAVEAAHDAATSLETIGSLAGRTAYGDPPIKTYMETFMDVRLYANARAGAARASITELQQHLGKKQ
jgi:hypothetical protein